MKIIERWEDLVHTHFVTDAVRLPSERTRQIERAISPVLRTMGILFGIHFAHARRDRGIRIVLECQPKGKELEHVQRELARIIEPIPIRPPTVASIGIETGTNEE
jgi:hypothetical protein